MHRERSTIASVSCADAAGVIGSGFDSRCGAEEKRTAEMWIPPSLFNPGTDCRSRPQLRCEENQAQTERGAWKKFPVFV